MGPRLFNLFEKIFFGEKNRIYPKIGLKGELGFYSKKGSKLGRELGEGEIWVKRVVLTALRAWLAVVIKHVNKNPIIFIVVNRFPIKVHESIGI